MNAKDYENLLQELLSATRDAEESGDDEEEQRSVNTLENRLLAQQTDLLGTASRLRLRPPRLRPDDSDPVDTCPDTETALRLAEQEADTADADRARALELARRPPFLPRQRAIVRHLAVYAICAVAAGLIESIGVLANGFVAAAWLFAVAPFLAFAVGFVVIGRVGRPRLMLADRKGRKGSLPTRHPRPGLMLCLILSAVMGVWWLLA